MYKLEILHQSVEMVKTKSQKVFGPNSFVCRSYRGKTDWGPCVESSIQNVVLRASRRKISKILSCGTFFLVFLMKSLSKCPNSKKPP